MNVTLHKRRLQGYQAKDMEFAKKDLSNTSAFGSKWTDCSFTDCDLSLSDFSGSAFENVTFDNCDLRLASFRASSLRDCTFLRCDMQKSSFLGCSPITKTQFHDCQMHYSGFFEATVIDCRFVDSNLHGADLRFIEAARNDFTGAVLWNAAVQIGCQFFSSKFDERTVNLWTAIGARVHPDTETAKMLRQLSGKEYDLATRLMDSPEDRVTEEVQDVVR